jgi:hypothetical protein
MSHVRITILKGQGLIEVVADLASAWTAIGKGWGFKEQETTDYGDKVVGCSVEIYCHGSTKQFGRDHIKSLIYADAVNWSSVSIENQTLRVSTSLDEGWGLSHKGNPRIQIKKRISITVEGKLPNGSIVKAEQGHYDLDLWVWKAKRGLMTVPDEFDPGDGHALPGGRPGSKRSH